MGQSSLIKRITSITAARSVSIVAALLVSMILTRILSKESYGEYRTVWILFGLMGPVATSSLLGLVYYRISQNLNRGIVILNTLIWSLAFSLIMGLTMWLGFPVWEKVFHAQNLAVPFRNFSVYLFFTGYTSAIEALFVMKHRKKWLFYHNVFFNLLEFLSVVLPFLAGYDLAFVTLCLIVPPLIRSIFLSAFVFKDVIHAEMSHFSRLFWEDGKYLWGLVLISVAGVAAYQLDTWIIRWFYEDNAVFATYSVGARKIPFVSALISSVSAALIVQIGKQVQERKLSDSVILLAKASSMILRISLPFLALIYVFSEEIMQLLFGGYENAADIFRVYLGTILFQIILQDTVLLAAGKSNLVFRAGVLELMINFILSIVLVYTIGILGPALATLISNIFFMWYCNRLVNSEFGTSYHWYQYVNFEILKPALFSFLLIFTLSYFLKWWIGNGILLFILGGILIAVYEWFSNKEYFQRLKSDLLAKEHDE